MKQKNDKLILLNQLKENVDYNNINYEEICTQLENDKVNYMIQMKECDNIDNTMDHLKFEKLNKENPDREMILYLNLESIFLLKSHFGKICL